MNTPTIEIPSTGRFGGPTWTRCACNGADFEVDCDTSRRATRQPREALRLAMFGSVTHPAESNEILFGIVSQLAACTDVVNLKLG